MGICDNYADHRAGIMMQKYNLHSLINVLYFQMTKKNFLLTLELQGNLCMELVTVNSMEVCILLSLGERQHKTPQSRKTGPKNWLRPLHK